MSCGPEGDEAKVGDAAYGLYSLEVEVDMVVYDHNR
jgi:hypothetical protein